MMDKNRKAAIAVQELTMAAWCINKGFSKGGSERESDSIR